VRKSNFLLTKKPQKPKYIDYELINVNGKLKVNEWGFLPDQAVVDNFTIQIIEKDEGNNLSIEGKIMKNDEIHCYFAIFSDRIAVQMSQTFAKIYDMVVCLASQEIVASTRVFPKN
jgi:hypothetical protein